MPTLQQALRACGFTAPRCKSVPAPDPEGVTALLNDLKLQQTMLLLGVESPEHGVYAFGADTGFTNVRRRRRVITPRRQLPALIDLLEEELPMG